ncbi:hypothetical protein GDO81_027394 [Engystomops pustulosus]|uniref:Uncharacterized protein n=1 Tax=Engystomops pustulosus TaxID=76066 RepID=A0AAV6ZHS4_ENGPU|nr:hypothetical protein GDO81_027394 [Engystomops pustulosus]
MQNKLGAGLGRSDGFGLSAGFNFQIVSQAQALTCTGKKKVNSVGPEHGKRHMQDIGRTILVNRGMIAGQCTFCELWGPGK